MLYGERILTLGRRENCVRRILFSYCDFYPSLTNFSLQCLICRQTNFRMLFLVYCRSQWPRGLRRRSTAARPLRSCFRIPPGAWSVCCVLSGRGLCDEVITRPEESYRLWRVAVCDHENLVNEQAIARAGLQCQRK
jgi:hypothetical protein